MSDGAGDSTPRRAVPPMSPTPRALDAIAVSWYRWRLLSGYYDTREVLSVIAARLTGRDAGPRRA
ncbi:MAG TPA: hypothetical protein VJR92_08125 [Gemmatimonadaceae bacterium]|nr:hypothetical protein [Gemmatimonadaceae bacterium]